MRAAGGIMPARNKVFKLVPQIYIYRFIERRAPFTDCSVFMLAIKLKVGYTIP